MPHREHPNEDELLKFASRELKPSDRTRVVTHLQICRNCDVPGMGRHSHQLFGSKRVLRSAAGLAKPRL
jgi:hypothetical protein